MKKSYKPTVTTFEKPTIVKKQFTPITLTLESQEEVAMMMAIFSFSPIICALDEASSTGSMGGDFVQLLKGEDNKGYEKFLKELSDYVR
jgi:hypothetical protein